MKHNKNALPRTLLALTLIGGFIFPAAAQDWSPRLEKAAQGEFRDPMETLRIHIPATVSTEVLRTLALELDNIDITAMVSRSGEYALFTPVQALPWGTHVLRLVEYAEDGSIYERGYWEFQVRRTSVFREVDYAADINLMASNRLTEKNLDAGGAEEPDGFTGQGSGVFQGRVADDNWQISGQMDLIYNTEDELTANGDKLDMGEYLISGSRDHNKQFNLGHHALAQNSLIMEGFYRRGLSASMGFASLNSSATGFVMRSQEVIGFQQGLGLSDSHNRVDGVVWESQPFSDNPQQLYVAATYLNGEKTEAGVNVGEDPSTQEGDAMSLVADSSLLDQQLRLRGEVASTKASINSSSVTLEDESDNAVAFLIAWTPRPDEPDSRFFWNTGLEVSQVDTYFLSIANPGLANDKKLNRLYVNTDWQGLSAQMSTARETDNVNDLDDRPRIETRLNQLLLNYSLTEQPQEGSWLEAIGTPSVSLQLSNTTQEQIREALTVLYADLDIENDTWMLSNNFSKQTWSWGWSYAESDQQNKVDALQDQITRSRNLNASIRLNDNISLSPSIQSQTTRLAFDNSSSDTSIYSLNSQFLFTDRWNGSISLNQSDTSSDSTLAAQDLTTSTLSLQFTWNWIQAKNKHPGFDIVLSGAWQDTDDKINDTNDLETYQLFLSLVMKLPMSSAE